MYYKIIFSFLFMLVCGVVGADAEDSRYRVEILVLSHIEHDEAPLEAARLEDFSNALDYLTPPPDGETAAADSDGVREPAAQQAPASDPEPAGLDGAADEDGDGEPVCAVVQVAEMGPEMQEAWRRLRLSGPFRPLQYLAWEQPGIPPFPALRVHDLESVLTEDPWRALREAPQDDMVDLAMAGDGPLPSPIEYFRLDGRVRLVRTRFLHLDVWVELREPVFDPAPAQPQPQPAASLLDLQDAEPQPTSFLVHRLNQRRQVKTGRMEYFDGPVLGVLAFITDISDTLEEETPSSP